MKRLLIAAALCLAFAVQGVAQDTAANAPATKEDVEKYLQAIHSHEMMLDMMSAMAKPMHQMVHEQYLKDKDRLPADFEVRMNKLVDDMMKNLPFDQMMQATVPVYQKYFTKGDMDALVAFYTSPTGQKLLKQTPSVTMDSMQAMMPIMRQQMEAMNQRLRQQAADLAKGSTNKGTQ